MNNITTLAAAACNPHLLGTNSLASAAAAMALQYVCHGPDQEDLDEVDEVDDDDDDDDVDDDDDEVDEADDYEEPFPGLALEMFISPDEDLEELEHPFKLVDALSYNLLYVNGLTILTLWKCRIPLKAAQQLGAALQVNTTIRKLSLNYNMLQTSEAVHLFAALPFNTTLRLLDLSFNHIGPQTKPLAAYLEQNDTLQFLLLHRNYIRCGVLPLLYAAPALCGVDLSNNFLYSVDDTTGAALAAYLRSNPPNLRYLLLNDNSFSAACRLQIMGAVIDVNTNLLQFDMDGEAEHMDEAAEAIADTALQRVLERNHALYLATFWSPAGHMVFPATACHPLIMATLLCAQHSQQAVRLNTYLWPLIFSFFQRKDFLNKELL